MSFVNVVLTDDFISVISDGQVTKNGVKIRDDLKKFYVHPCNYVVALTGYEQVLKDVFSELAHQPLLTFGGARCFVAKVLEKYQDVKDEFGEKVSSKLVIAGFDSKKARATAFEIGENISKTDYYSPTSISLNPPDIDFEPNKKITNGIVSINGKFELRQVQSVQISAVVEVAQKSKSVNNKIFKEVLHNV
jgi:hypothetical protein